MCDFCHRPLALNVTLFVGGLWLPPPVIFLHSGGRRLALHLRCSTRVIMARLALLDEPPLSERGLFRRSVEQRNEVERWLMAIT